MKTNKVFFKKNIGKEKEKSNIKKVELSRGEDIYDKTLTRCLISSRIKISSTTPTKS